jgi:hypothetical protein
MSAHFCRDRGSIRCLNKPTLEEIMTAPRIRPTSQVSRPERGSEPTQLSHRYGSIGIQAVAAAARYLDLHKRSLAPAAAPRIELRFVESAG